MTLPLDDTLKIGVNTMLRRTEPASGPWMPTVDELVEVVQQVDRLGFDSFWCGDHVAFAIPFLDPIAQIAQAAVVSRRLTFGTAVYLLPLRHPTPGRQANCHAGSSDRRPLHLRRRHRRRVPKGIRGLRRADQRARAAPG